MKKNLLCAALGMAALLGTSGAVQAQAPNRWCSTDEHNAELARTFHDPLLAAERAAADALAERLQRDDVFARQFYARQAAGAVRNDLHMLAQGPLHAGARPLHPGMVGCGSAGRHPASGVLDGDFGEAGLIEMAP